PVADFELSSNACLDELVKLKNTSIDANSYEWDFCSGDLESDGLNITTFTPSDLSTPVGISFVKFNGSWYGFLSNLGNNTITRINFGNSLSNTPTFSNLGNLGGKLSEPQDIEA